MYDEFKAYKLYIALKLHFKEKDYDAVKFRGVTRASQSSLEFRNDRHFFYKLAKHPDPPNLLIANFITGDKWIGDIVSDRGLEIYKEWLDRNKSLSLTFKEDIQKLHPDFKSNLTVTNGQYPHLLKEYKRGNISPETITLLNKYLKFTDKWDEQISDTFIWPKDKMLIEKYSPFVNLEKSYFYSILSLTFR